MRDSNVSGTSDGSDMALPYSARSTNAWWWNPVLLLSATIAPGILAVGFIATCNAPCEFLWPVKYVLPLVGVILIAVALLFVGGYVFEASDKGVTIRAGYLGIQINHIPYERVQLVEVVNNFQPFAEFMGYGWRVNFFTKSTGYCLGSGEAVRISTGDWTYVLVTTDAQKLSAAIGKMIPPHKLA